MTTLIALRLARATDLAAVEQLLARAFPRLLKRAYPPSAMVTAVPLLQRTSPRQLDSGCHWVAQAADGRIVGAGGWSEYRRSWSAPRGGAIRQFVTDPDHLRRGIGQAIMARVLQSARARKLMWLDCQATFNAVPFYRSCGFVSLGGGKVGLAPGIDFAFERMRMSL